MFALTTLRLRKALLLAAAALTLGSTALAQSKEKVIHTFHGGKDGDQPEAAPILDAAGNLYGTTYLGGSQDCLDGCGTVYELIPQTGGGWTEKKLHVFHFDGKDGVFPAARLAMDKSGFLY